MTDNIIPIEKTSDDFKRGYFHAVNVILTLCQGRNDFSFDRLIELLSNFKTMESFMSKEKINRFIKHIPSFVDYDGEKPSFEFNTVNELLNHSEISVFKEPWRGEIPFYRFSKSDNTLMAEYDEGKMWWVIGFIQYPALVELPIWEPKES